jgi:hypothetical protein
MAFYTPNRPLLFALLALSAGATLALAGENDTCIECGLRRPGSRPRELAILESVAAATRHTASAELDFSSADRLPVRSRPTAAQAARMGPNDPLLRAMHADDVMFDRMRYLLPEKFRIADGSQFQPMIDDAVSKLAATDAGRRAVCPFAASDKTVAMYFSVSEGTARKIARDCQGYPTPPSVRARLAFMSEVRPPFQPEPAVPAKKFVFLFSDGARPAIEGYTAKNNVTYLVLTKETQNADTLSRMLAHEIAVSYDQLSRLGYQSNVQTIEDQGVGLAFGKDQWAHTFEDPKSNKELEALKCSFRDPAIRYAATAQRAFVFEDEVAAQSGGSPSVATTGSCSEILAKNSVLLQAMARTVSWDTGWYEAACGVEKDPAKRLQQVLSRIHQVSQTNLTCRDPKDCGGKKQMSLCDLLLTPRVGPNNRDLDSGGPRPRMGGGWDGAAVAREELIQKASLNPNDLTPAEIRELGNALSFPNVDELDREERGPASRTPLAAHGVSL